MRRYDDFTSCYVDLIKLTYSQNEFESKPRGMSIKENLGVSFTLTNPRRRLPYVKDREFSITYAIAETVWYLIGSDSTAWISNYSAFWNKISEGGKARSAYGSRIFRCHPLIAHGELDQWNYVIDELKKDPDSRRAVIHIRVPDDHESQLDVPCTLSLQFFIRDNKLHLYVTMRSSDIVLGIPYDLFAFTLLQELMALELGVELGTYNHTSNSLHVYERHYEMCEKILASSVIVASDEMPKIERWPDVWGLDLIQHKARTAEKEIDLIKLLPQEDEYWSDWSRLLILHRAQKLKFKDVEKLCRDSIKFNGYNFFDK